ncbi:MAG TPA: methyltransferase [Mycobacterium sp.]
MSIDNAATRDDHDRVFQMIMAAWGSQAVRTLALLSVAEHLHGAALTAEEIAARESSDPALTYRLLRAGAALGFLEYHAHTGQFTGTPLLDVLHEDSPLSLKYYAQAATGPAFWLTNMLMPETVIRGSTRVVDALGSSVFEYFAEHQDQAREFSAAMTNLSTPVIREAVTAMDTTDAHFVVDVGGADGAFIAALLQHNPALTGAVLDLAQVIPGVIEAAEAHGLQSRMTGIVGDFFQEVPAADVYLLKFVLHDWDDESCVRILSNIRTAMKPGARLFIVEMAITATTSISATLMDLGMLAAFTGQERELPHFTNLLHSARLEIGRAVELHRPYYLIEAHAQPDHVAPQLNT